MTSIGSISSAATFSQDVGLRDRTCVVTQQPVTLIATHLVPKRVGSEGAKEVFTRFVGARGARHIDIFQPGFGILLVLSLQPLVTLTVCKGTKSSPWQGRINYGGVSVIYLYPLIFLWSLTSHALYVYWPKTLS